MSAFTATPLADLLTRSRTARDWADSPVPADVVTAVYDAVRWGPTLMNTSPLRLLLVTSAEGRERLAGHMSGHNVDVVRRAPLSVVVAADMAFHEHLPTLAPHAPGAAERFAGDPARERIAREQTWLQAGYLVVGLQDAGLAVGAMAGMDAAGIDADLLAGTTWRALMVLNLGFPADVVTDRPRAPRLDAAQVTREV